MIFDIVNYHHYSIPWGDVRIISPRDAVTGLPDIDLADTGPETPAGITGALPSRPGGGLSRVSSGEQVGQYVRRRIFDGALKPGQRVPQDAIAQTLGVSRIPVREALIALEREGWVTIVPHRGAFVNPIDESAVLDQYELFALIYGFAVRRAIERQGESLAAQLAPLQQRIAAAGDDADEMFLATMAFHRAVVTAAHSPRLRSLLRQATSIVPGNFFDLVPGSGKVEKQSAAAIVRAVKRRDADEAAQAYAEMMRKQGDLVVDLLRTKGIFGEAA
jgi:DNA-binding GntR family transcriptional regulator